MGDRMSFYCSEWCCWMMVRVLNHLGNHHLQSSNVAASHKSPISRSSESGYRSLANAYVMQRSCAEVAEPCAYVNLT